MEHRLFLSLTVLVGIIIVSLFPFYPYVGSFKVGVKVIPVILLLLQTVFYKFKYRCTGYACSLFNGFLFCLIGDILLGFVDTLSTKQDFILFIVGGLSFSVARICLIIGLHSHPYSGSYGLSYTKNRVMTCAVPTFIFIIGTIISFEFFRLGNMLMVTIADLYLILSGLHVTVSFIRVNEFQHESIISSILAGIGSSIFTISDIILIWNMLAGPVLSLDLLALYMYWLSMYLIGLSVIRNWKDENIEKLGNPNYTLLI